MFPLTPFISHLSAVDVTDLFALPQLLLHTRRAGGPVKTDLVLAR